MITSRCWCGVMVACALSLHAAERVWNGADNANWTDPDVWTVGGLPATLPEIADTVTINNGTAVNLSGAALDDTNRFALVQLSGNQRGTLRVGPGGYLSTVLLEVSRSGAGPATPGTVIVDGGYFSASGAQNFGTDSVNNPSRLEVINGGNYTNASLFRVYCGSVLVSNATFTALNTSYLHGSSATSVFEIVDSTVSTKTFAIGRDVANASGKACRNILRVRSGSLSVAGDLEIGHTGLTGLTITGAVEQTGGTLFSASGNVRLPITATAVGEYLLGGGLFSIQNTADSLYLGGRDGATKGFFTMADGVFTNRGGTQVGSYTNAYGLFSIAGGRAVLERNLMLGAIAGSTGEVALTGGTLILASSSNLNVGNASNAIGRCQVSGDGLLSATGRNVLLGSAAFGSGTLVLDGGTVSNGSTYVANAVSANGTLIVSNGLHNMTGSMIVGNNTNATGRCEVDGGLLNLAGSITLGGMTNSAGAFVMTGGAVSNNGVNVGNVLSSTGTVEITGGQLYAAGEFYIGHGVKFFGGNGTFSMSGGKLLTLARFIVGSYGSGYATVSGGEIEALRTSATTECLVVGRDAATFGQLVMTGGALKGTNELVIARDTGSTGLVYVAGGDIYVNTIRRGGGRSALDLAGGTLHPYNRDTAFAFTASLTNDIGFGATGTLFGLSPVDKDGVERAMHITGTFSGNGGLAKRGTGTVTLGGNLAYTGNTVVETGTLALSNTVTSLASGVIEVQSGAALDVSVNRVAAFALANGQALVGGGTVTGPVRIAGGASVGGTDGGTLTIDGDLTLDAGSTLLFNLLSGAYSRVHVTGNLTLPATANLTVNGAATKDAEGRAMLTWGGSLIMPTPTRWTVSGEKDPLAVFHHDTKTLALSYLHGTVLFVK